MLDLSLDPVFLSHEKAELLVLLRHAIDKLDLEFSRVAAEFDQEMYWDQQRHRLDPAQLSHDLDRCPALPTSQ